MKKILYIIGVMLALASCTKDDISTGSADSLVKFTTETVVTRAVDNKSAWEAGDKIGIYSIEEDKVQYNNVAYGATESDNVISFSPVGTEKIYYSDLSDKTNFIAYYPYNQANTSKNIAVDLITDPSDLLISSTVTQENASFYEDIDLEFSHALTLFQITLIISKEVSSLDGLTAYISNSYTSATYDVTSRSLTMGSRSKMDLDVVIADDKESAVVTALVMPCDYSDLENITLNIVVDDRTYDKELNPDWDAAYKYSYTAKVGYDYLELSGADIEPWGTEQAGNSTSSLVDLFYNSDEKMYYIYTAKGLSAFRDLVNGLDNTKEASYYGFDKDLFGEMNLDIDGTLATNIDLSGICGEDLNTNWNPIGRYYDNAEYPYNGTFNGNGYEISGLYISNDANKQGLFRKIDSDGVVCNLGVSGTIINSSTNKDREVGGITSHNEGFIINCYSSVNVSASITKVGGVVGVNYGDVVNCYNTESVTGYTNVGGIVGYNEEEAYVGYCYNVGQIGLLESYDPDGTRVGGVVGYILDAGTDDDPSIKGCFSIDTTPYSIGQLGVNESDGPFDGNVYDKDYLQSELFARIMNYGAYTYNNNSVHIDRPLDACAWTYVKDGYPVLNFGVEPDGNYPYDIMYDNEEFVYKIYTGLGLQAFAALVNYDALPSGVSYSGGDEYFKFNSKQLTIDGLLMKDIDLTSVCGKDVNNGTNWTPIGTYYSIYQGDFDGDGFEVSGLYIGSATTNYQGLFGYIENATISNLGVDGSVNITNDYYYVGGVVGYADSSTIEDCYNKATISGAYTVGGVAGYNNSGSIINCYSIGAVTASGASTSVGGVAGNNTGSIINSYSTGAVTASGAETSVGGVAGNNTGSVINSYNWGNITAKASSCIVGGVIGYDNNGTVTSCYSSGSVSSASSDKLGGVLGYNSSNSTVSYCYYDNDTVDDNYEGQQDNRPSGAIGLTGDNTSTSNVDGYSTNDMKTGSVVSLLNNGAYIYNISEGSPTTLAYAWTTASSYPVFDPSSTPKLTAFDTLSISYDTLTETYEICTANGLAAFAALVNGSSKPSGAVTEGNETYFNFGTKHPNIKCKLTADIYLETFCSKDLDVSWTPIGYYNSSSDNGSFTGTFDGDGHKIVGLYISDATSYNQGLFGLIENATITNLGVSGSVSESTDSSNGYVGGLVGEATSSTITNCYSACDVYGYKYVGGIAGYAKSTTITNCYNTGSVTGKYQRTGGLVGSASGDSSYTNITSCYNTGAVNSSNNYTGGLVGYIYYTYVTACYNSGSVTSTYSNIGGLAGYMSYSCTIKSCYSYGPVSTSSSGYTISGVLGSYSSSSSDMVVEYCYYDYDTVDDDYEGKTTNNKSPTVAIYNSTSYGTTTNVEGLSTDNMTGSTSTLLTNLTTGASGYWQADSSSNSSNNGYPVLINND